MIPKFLGISAIFQEKGVEKEGTGINSSALLVYLSEP